MVNETFDDREVWHSIPGNRRNFLNFSSQFAHSSNTCSRCAVYCYSAGTRPSNILVSKTTVGLVVVRAFERRRSVVPGSIPIRPLFLK